MMEAFFWDSRILLIGAGDQGHVHRHYPYQLIISIDQDITAHSGNGLVRSSKVLLIDSNIEHACEDHGASISIFFDPVTDEGKAFKHAYIKDRISVLPFEKMKNVIGDFEAFKRSAARDIRDAAALFDAILRSYIDEGMKLRPTDQRIRKILDMLPDIPDKKILVKELAESVCLSETRFIHLFKENMGIPVRRFLLWKRLLDAVKLIQGGEAFTASAIEAGFSDYAHFSRTFKEIFSSSVESIFKNDQFIHVHG